MKTMRRMDQMRTWRREFASRTIGAWCAAMTLWLCVGARAQPVPHHIAGVHIVRDEGVLLSLEGRALGLVPGLTGTLSNQFGQMFDTYFVESSTNLLDWKRVGTLLRTNTESAPLLFRDGQSWDGGRRFYRTTSPPLLTWFLKPTGPHAVGVVDRVMLDPSRTDPYRYTPKTNAFVVTFFYPAIPPEAGALPDSMWPQRIASDSGVYSMLGLDARWARLFAAAHGHRYRGAPLAVGAAPFPVVFLSHGLTFRLAYSRMAEELASHGFVVIAVDHPDCFATEFPDGRYLKGGAPDNAGRFRDMEFLVNEVVRLNGADEQFSGRLNLDRMGILGASYGGIAAEMCRRDDRLKCVALADGNNFQTPPTGIGKPCLLMTGTQSEYLALNQTLFNQCKSDAVLLQIQGADHRTFWDEAWGPKLPAGRPRAVAMDAALVWFFTTQLKGEAPSFPIHPEIVKVQRK